MKLGYFAPLPPARSGVAAYAEALLAALRQMAPVGDQVALGEGDLNLYQIGNNPLHASIYQRALEQPGVVILHDAVLHHFLMGHLPREQYLQEFAYNYGVWQTGCAERLWQDRAGSGGDPRYFEYPMLRRLAERSRAVIVHNPEAAALVHAHAAQARVEVVPHLFEPPSIDAIAAERFRDRLPAGTVFGVFGHLRESKRLPTVLRALEQVPQASLLVSGDFVSEDYARAFRDRLQGPRITWLPYAPETEFWIRARAVDACINLKWPSAGETSGIAVRLAGIGKPVIGTSSADESLMAIGVEPGPAEVAHLAAAMQWLAESPKDRRMVGERAAAHIREHHQPARIAARIWQIVTPIVTLMALTMLLAGASLAAVKREAQVPMRDGVKLAANIFLPQAEGRFAVILIRTPYGKGTELGANDSFVNHGFAVVVQDVRGRYSSEGKFNMLDQESADGEDTINWVAKQPWSNGRVGMSGGSYSGLAQWKAAAEQPSALKAIFPVHAGIDEYRDRFYARGGAMRLGHRMLWLVENLRKPTHRDPGFDRYVLHLPLRTMDKEAAGQTLPLWQQSLDHPGYDAFWRAMSVREQLNQVATPAFAVAGWFDPNVQSDLATITNLRRKSNSYRIAIGPWAHNMSVPFPGVDFGRDAGYPVSTMQLAWFDRWLNDKPGEVPGGPYSIFVMGANKWRDEAEWPLKRAVATRYYLAPDHQLSIVPPKDGADRYSYDPRQPVPTRGGTTCCNPAIFPWGPLDQRVIGSRPDVLQYQTPVLTEDLEVTGPIRVQLHISTSAPDTDFTAKLIDVFPSGEARLLTDGILRLRYREGLEKPVLAKPGQEYAITVDAGVTSNVFRAGHRIRLDIASSNFPKYDRNLNTGRPIADEKHPATAKQTIYRGGARASHVVLPIVR